MTDEATRLEALPWFLQTRWCEDRRGWPKYHELYGDGEDVSAIRERVLEFFGIEERHVVDEWENCCDDDADFSTDIQKLEEPDFLKSETGWHYAGAWDTEDGEFVRLYVRLTTPQPTGRTDSERLDWFEENCGRARSRWNEHTSEVEWCVQDEIWASPLRAAMDSAQAGQAGGE